MTYTVSSGTLNPTQLNFFPIEVRLLKQVGGLRDPSGVMDQSFGRNEFDAL